MGTVNHAHQKSEMTEIECALSSDTRRGMKSRKVARKKREGVVVQQHHNKDGRIGYRDKHKPKNNSSKEPREMGIARDGIALLVVVSGLFVRSERFSMQY